MNKSRFIKISAVVGTFAMVGGLALTTGAFASTSSTVTYDTTVPAPTLGITLTPATGSASNTFSTLTNMSYSPTFSVENTGNETGYLWLEAGTAPSGLTYSDVATTSLSANDYNIEDS